VTEQDNDGRLADKQLAAEHDAVAETEPNASVTVSHTNNTSKRVWDKRYFCFYCECSVVRLPRHLYSAHSSEPAVAEIMAIKDKQKKLH